MLSAWALAAIILAVIILAKALADSIATEALFLLLTLSMMGLSSAAAVWLRQLSQRARDPSHQPRSMQ